MNTSTLTLLSFITFAVSNSFGGELKGRMYNLPEIVQTKDGELKRTLPIADDEEVEVRITDLSIDGGPIVFKDKNNTTSQNGRIKIIGPNIHLFFNDSTTGVTTIAIQFYRKNTTYSYGESPTQIIEKIIIPNSDQNKISDTTFINIIVPRPSEMPKKYSPQVESVPLEQPLQNIPHGRKLFLHRLFPLCK